MSTHHTTTRSRLRKTLAKAGATIAASAFALGMIGCESTPADPVQPKTQSFTVTISNVSTPQTVMTDRANGIVPISGGAFAVFQGADPIFQVGQMASMGLEAIAEDGETASTVMDLENNANVTVSGMFTGPNGPILPGEPATFTFTAEEGDMLQFATMFVQSNDWFYGFQDQGLALFDNGEPISGDFTMNVGLYDAGTEEDTAPGTGPDQKLAQPMGSVNVGPADDNTSIRPAGGFTIPMNSSVIQVSVTLN